MKKLLIAGLSVLAAGTLLTGCMKIKEGIVVNSDGSCVVGYEMSIEKDALLKTYEDMSGINGGFITESILTDELTKNGFVLVNIDGKDYYKISNETLPSIDDKCDSITDFYRYLSKNLSGMLYQKEDDAVSISETSVVLKMPANSSLVDDLMQEMLKSAGSGGTNNEMLDMAKSEKVLESLKSTVMTYSVTFPTKIKDKSAGVTLSEDGKTVSISFPVITDKAYNEYAYCENDIAVTGALNGVTYNRATISIPEGITATLNGNPVSESTVECDKTGTYNFQLSDGTTKETLCFTVDNLMPRILSWNTDGEWKLLNFSIDSDTILKDNTISVYDIEGGIKKIELDGKDVLSTASVTSLENKDKNSLVSSYPVYSIAVEEGEHRIEVVDNFSNAQIAVFTIDNTKPSVKGVQNGKTYTKPVTIKFSDKNGIKTAKLNGKNVKTGAKVSKKGTYTLKVTDNAGNVQTIKFKVKK